MCFLIYSCFLWLWRSRLTSLTLMQFWPNLRRVWFTFFFFFWPWKIQYLKGEEEASHFVGFWLFFFDLKLPMHGSQPPTPSAGLQPFLFKLNQSHKLYMSIAWMKNTQLVSQVGNTNLNFLKPNPSLVSNVGVITDSNEISILV